MSDFAELAWEKILRLVEEICGDVVSDWKDDAQWYQRGPAIIRRAHNLDCDSNRANAAAEHALEDLIKTYQERDRLKADRDRLRGVLKRILSSEAWPKLDCPQCGGTGCTTMTEHQEGVDIAEHEVPCDCVDWSIHDIARTALGEGDVR